MINETFGWLWITLGFATGAMMGLRFHQPNWLGGYDSFRRRLLRLGHISLIALGALNVLFALSAADPTAPSPATRIASMSMIVGGVTMPLCCGLTAWQPRFRPLFAVPVLSLVVGGIIVTAGVFST